jgi:hypothetical protein
MSQALFSTLAALAGTVIGGLTSFITAWIMQRMQAQTTRIAAETAKREEIYGRFMDELAELYSVAVSGEPVQWPKLVKPFGLRGRISLVATPPVVAAADKGVKFLVDLYLGPKLSADAVRDLINKETSDISTTFANACREEFRTLGLG